jgi:nucleotide-binding universal stress UspA family protein
MEKTTKIVRKILAPTDLSSHSEVGLRYALNLARELGAEVTVYYVVSKAGREEKKGDTGTGTVLERKLQERRIALTRFLSDHLSDLLPWIRVREKVEMGAPATHIAMRAKIEGSDLIVMCGPKALDEPAKQSIARAVIRNAPCPVLLLHPAETTQISLEATANI